MSKIKRVIPLAHISFDSLYVDFDAAIFEGCIVLPPRIWPQPINLRIEL